MESVQSVIPLPTQYFESDDDFDLEDPPVLNPTEVAGSDPLEIRLSSLSRSIFSTDERVVVRMELSQGSKRNWVLLKIDRETIGNRNLLKLFSDKKEKIFIQNFLLSPKTRMSHPSSILSRQVIGKLTLL